MNLTSRATCQLTACGRRSLDDRRHLLIRELNDVVEHENSACSRSQLFEHNQQRHPDALVQNHHVRRVHPTAVAQLDGSRLAFGVGAGILALGAVLAALLIGRFKPST
jgi:hypothetical protein